MTAAAAAASVAIRHVRQQQNARIAQQNAFLRERRQREEAYNARMRREAYDHEQEMKRRERQHFARYDVNGSNLLERDELRKFLQDVRPNEPTPSDELCDTLITMSGNENGVAMHALADTSLRYFSYLSEKQSLDRFFSALDLDGSGSIEESELRRALRELGPEGYQPTEGDLDFVYAACRIERGEPVPQGAPMLLLKPALVEWAKLTRNAAADAAAQRIVIDGTRLEPASRAAPTQMEETVRLLREKQRTKPKGSSSSMCVLQ